MLSHHVLLFEDYLFWSFDIWRREVSIFTIFQSIIHDLFLSFIKILFFAISSSHIYLKTVPLSLCLTLSFSSLFAEVERALARVRMVWGRRGFSYQHSAVPRVASAQHWMVEDLAPEYYHCGQHCLEIVWKVPSHSIWLLDRNYE